MIDMFKKLKAFDAQSKLANVLPQAFSSHPALDKRIARLEAAVGKASAQIGFPAIGAVDWKRP